MIAAKCWLRALGQNMSAIDEQARVEREAMVAGIERAAATLASSLGRGTFAPRVLDALRQVPRHLFVPPAQLPFACRDRPLPIGYGQTISQPFIVALMTDILDLKDSDRVLEIGTGCGYQTAVLARLVREVFTIELCEPLAERAAQAFKTLGIGNVRARVGDGHAGWPEAAPFDAILVAAAPAEIPGALVQQLATGGRLAIPVGAKSQQLILVQKQSDQSTVLRDIIPVCFVPLTRQSDPPDELH
jgi:protein-L-isoaspartate(D-aspartate) O-methyltransferase